LSIHNLVFLNLLKDVPKTAKNQYGRWSGATEQDIAACLGHSTTVLVKRYAHLSPSHLKGVVERVSAFRQTNTAPRQSYAPEYRLDTAVDSSTSVGTVIKP
jgi:hypothetical protein